MRDKPKSICTVEDCETPVTPGGGRGLCQKHYMRIRRTGSTETNPTPHARKNPEVCILDGCSRRSAAFGYCDTHYRQVRKPYEQKVPKACRGCDSPVVQRGARAVFCDTCAPINRTLRPYSNFTVKDYLKMYAEQEGRCLLCHRNFERLDVEHCHSSGRIRGLMCGQCNTAMGLFSDDPVLLRRAADYLESHLLRSA